MNWMKIWYFTYFVMPKVTSCSNCERKGHCRRYIVGWCSGLRRWGMKKISRPSVADEWRRWQLLCPPNSSSIHPKWEESAVSDWIGCPAETGPDLKSKSSWRWRATSSLNRCGQGSVPAQNSLNIVVERDLTCLNLTNDLPLAHW